MDPFARTWQQTWACVLSPRKGYLARREEGLDLASAVATFLVWRTPITVVGWLFGLNVYKILRNGLLTGEGPLGALLSNFPELRLPPEVVLELAATFPPLPSWGKLLPWLFLLAPLALLGLWLHHVCWDHGMLWILRGLGSRRSMGETAMAQAEAMQVGSVGAGLALLGNLPLVGCFLGLPLAVVGIYFWIQRGYALAAWHGCPPWKGVVATLLHAVGVLVFYGGLVVMTFMMAAAAAAVG